MRQGEVWLVSLDPTIGSELRKTRPAIVVSNNDLGKLPLKIIVPLTDWKDHYTAAAWLVKVTPDGENQLFKDLAADCFQVRSVAEQRLVKRLGQISPELLEQIRRALVLVFS